MGDDEAWAIEYHNRKYSIKRNIRNVLKPANIRAVLSFSLHLTQEIGNS